MECPNHVWSVIETGVLDRQNITESSETMQRYDCEYVSTEASTRSPSSAAAPAPANTSEPIPLC